ncbi:hypothetical protein Aph01nite_59400 [Acrocarpospora phusangensis]|uniref:Uncharacterized protein n=1 Tax=Acrocarpospora phusangensis TaxID=1070424 RepID=A0A919QHR6_9ACTN|nr:hypothetical protein [Acrocarpospora phusangensis]GIH27630.1 hypothetical protein Aph01nite_59400 [Acrocarpospora phusangensis]
MNIVKTNLRRNIRKAVHEGIQESSAVLAPVKDALKSVGHGFSEMAESLTKIADRYDAMTENLAVVTRVGSTERIDHS